MELATKAADEKFCSECAAVIKAKAVICPKCGCPQGRVAATTGVPAADRKSKNTAGLLAMLLGGVGVHKFYLSRPLEGVLYMIFCWTFIPALLGLIDGVRLFGMSTDAFDQQYNEA